MKTETYKQCRFQKGDEYTIAWIPAWAAVVGNRIRLITLDNEFWTVLEAGNELPASEVLDMGRNYRDFQESLKGGGIDQ